MKKQEPEENVIHRFDMFSNDVSEVNVEMENLNLLVTWL